MIDGYKIYKNKILGEGASSKVYLGRSTKYNDYMDVAIKVIKLTSTKNITSYIDEINILQSLDHVNILKMYSYYEDTKNSLLYIITEYCNVGNLEKIIEITKTKENREEITKIYMRQLKDALKYIHNKNIIHRDLKPANILVKGNIDSITNDDNILKLADFGLSKEIEPDKNIKGTVCGSPYFMSPEILAFSKYDFGVDIWAFGIILYEFLYDEPFIDASNIYQLQKKIVTHEINLKKKYSDELQNLLDGLLQKNPDNRIKGDSFYEHNWFNKEIFEQNEISEQNEIITKTEPIKIPKKNKVYERIFFNSLDEDIFNMS